MGLVVEKGLVPDLAEAPPIGGNDPLGDSRPRVTTMTEGPER
jgi:hypothetical protein